MQSIKNDAENKILILYTLENTSVPLTKYDLSMVMLDNLLMNYFTFNQSLTDLKESHFILFDENFVEITNQGRNMLKLFLNSLDLVKKEMIDLYLLKNRHKVIEGNSIQHHIEVLDSEKFNVVLEIKERNENLMKLETIVPSHEIAESIINKFKNNHDDFYKTVINYLYK